MRNDADNAHIRASMRDFGAFWPSLAGKPSKQKEIPPNKNIGKLSKRNYGSPPNKTIGNRTVVLTILSLTVNPTHPPSGPHGLRTPKVKICKKEEEETQKLICLEWSDMQYKYQHKFSLTFYDF